MTTENTKNDLNKETEAEHKVIKAPKSTPNLKKLSGIASFSFFVFILDKLGHIIYNALINGFFGKLFTSYSTLQKRFKKGFCGYILFGNHRVRRFFKRVRKYIATDIEVGMFTKLFRRIIGYFCAAPLHFYGNFFLFFGIYTSVVYFIKLFLPETGEAIPIDFVVGASSTIASIPLMFSKVPLAQAIKQSVIGNMIFQGAFGFSDEVFKRQTKKVKSRGNIMLVLGLVAGIMSFFIKPAAILLGILFVVMLLLIASSPEIGVLLTIIILPFFTFLSFPTIYLSGLILITTFFYIVKVIRGKRVFNLELIDAAVFAFGIMILLSGGFSFGRVSSLYTAIVMSCLLIGYFLIVNLIKTEKWAKRCIIALVSSASIAALVGIFEFIFGESNQKWLDPALFSDIKLRVVSFFENPNMLSVFLIIAFPFAVALMLTSKNFNEKLLAFFACVILVLCTVFTWSRGAWLAIIFGTFIFFAVYTTKTFRIFGAAFIIVPLLQTLLPQNIIDRLLSISNLADSSISYRIYTWKGTLRAISDFIWGGIGFGDEAFSNIYPLYSYSGMETAQHSHSLYLQILLCAGIFGFIVFALIVFLYCQKSFEYIKNPENKDSRIYVAAAFSAIVSALIMGVFDYIWYNYRIFYIFWVVMAIGCAFIRVGNSEINRKTSEYEFNDYR